MLCCVTRKGKPLSTGRPTMSILPLPEPFWLVSDVSFWISVQFFLNPLQEAAPSIVNLQDTEGRTALHYAVASANMSVITTLVTTPGVYCNVSAIDYMFRTPLHWAAVLGFDEVVQYLLSVGSNPTAEDATKSLPLHYAVRWQSTVWCVRLGGH